MQVPHVKKKHPNTFVFSAMDFAKLHNLHVSQSALFRWIYLLVFPAVPSTCAHTQQLPHHVCATQWYPHKCRNPHVAPAKKKYPNNGIQMAKFLAIQITPIILDLFNGLEFEPKGDPHHHVAVSEGPSAWLSIKDHIFSK